jgi:DNA helicase II / ATP-dependent DNA helicase PcrA
MRGSIDAHRHLRDLNPAQRGAVEHGIGGDTKSPPALLIAAGAGTGKTETLAHRVAHLTRISHTGLVFGRR